MNKILETDTSVKLYQKADIITKDGVKVPLFPTEKDKETAAELGSESMKGFIVKIDKDKNQIHKESVYWAYGDEVIAKSLIDVKEKDNKVEVHEVELNDYYKHRRAFDNTYINGERNGKESEYDILSNDNRKKVRETQWKNNQKDGTEVFFYSDGVTDEVLWDNGTRKQKTRLSADRNIIKTKEYKGMTKSGLELTVSKSFENGNLKSELIGEEAIASSANSSHYDWDSKSFTPIEGWKYGKNGEVEAGYEFKEGTFGFDTVAIDKRDIRFIKKKLESKKSLNQAEIIASRSNSVLKDVKKAQNAGSKVSVKDILALKQSQKQNKNSN